MAAKRSRTKSSGVWTYMEKTGPTEVVCLLCKSVFVYCSGTTSFWHHLRVKHPQEHEGLGAEAKKKPVQVKHVRESDERENGVADPAKQKTISIFRPGAGIDFSVVPTGAPYAPVVSTGAPSGASTSVVTAYPILQNALENPVVFKQDPEEHCESERKEMIDRLVCEMIVRDLHPVNIVEDRGFGKLMNAMDPDYTLPNKKDIARSLLPELYAEQKGLLQKELEEVTSIAITMEIWTSHNFEVFLTVTVHYISKHWEQKYAVLETCRLRKNHTGLDIADELLRILKAWKIDGKVSCVVTDNEEKMVEAVTILNLPHMPCFAHTLNLVIQDALKRTEAVASVIKKVREIALYFQSNTEASEILLDFQVMNGQTPLKLKQDLDMNWNFTYRMLSRYVDLHSFVSDALNRSGKQDMSITSTEAEFIRGCLKALEPFELASVEISADKFASLAKALPLARNILDFLTLNLGSPLSQELARQMKKHVKGLEEKFIPGAATLLDPRFKKLAFAGSEYENVEKKLTEMMAVGGQSLSDAESEQNRTPTTLSIWSLFDQKVQQARCAPIGRTTGQALEFHRYYAKTPIQRHENPLAWWKERDCITPQLCGLARRFLCIPATSVPAKRLFSEDGKLISHRRRYIQESHVDMILFLSESLS